MGKNERHGFANPRGLSLRTYKREQHAHTSSEGSRDAGGLSMSQELLPTLRIARSDYLELGHLTAKYRLPAPSHAIKFLERELSRAIVVDDTKIQPDVATLRSHIAFHDEKTGRDWAVTLGHPTDFFSREDAISVLSPLGAALIGLSEDQSIQFQTADGRNRRVALVRVLHQPQRFGRRASARHVP